jgi:hypothetical protein
MEFIKGILSRSGRVKQAQQDTFEKEELEMELELAKSSKRGVDKKRAPKPTLEAATRT